MRQCGSTLAWALACLKARMKPVWRMKAMGKVLPVHEAQLLSYLRLNGYPVGLLINFHELHLKDGIKRLVNHL